MLLVIMQCEKKAQNFGISKYILYMIISLLPQSRRSRGRVHHSGYHGIGLTSHSATDMGRRELFFVDAEYIVAYSTISL